MNYLYIVGLVIIVFLLLNNKALKLHTNDYNGHKIVNLPDLPNNYQVLEDGDYVICAISGKKISLKDLNYWNVDLQEAYFSYIEASRKREKND